MTVINDYKIYHTSFMTALGKVYLRCFETCIFTLAREEALTTSISRI